MKEYSIIKITKWYAEKLREEAEFVINEKSQEGYEIISVALGQDANSQPTAFITIAEEIESIS